MIKRLLTLSAVLALAALGLPPAASQARAGASGQRERALSADEAGTAAPQGKEFKKVVDFEPGGDLRLNSDKGSLVLTAWDKNQVEVTARIDPPQGVGEDYGRRAVEGARVEVTGNSRSLTVRSIFDDVPYKDVPDGQSKSLPDIHYEIRAPRSLNVTVELDRSKLNLHGFKGRVEINTDRTSMAAGDLEGDLRIKMDRGEAHLSNLRGSLDIEADRTNCKLQRARIEGDSRLEIDRGEFEIYLPESQQLTVSANLGRKDNFESDFAVAMKAAGGKSFEGTINGGGPRLSIHADRGKVSLKRE
jgi:hypothetical protein